ncbi:MAG: hypothetical protein ACJASY_003463 [Halioglobus sp.]|jgi:hypothetical protein
MNESTFSEPQPSNDRPAEPAAISIVQRGNLKSLEQTLRKQWRLGQSIVLCWSADKRGLLVIFVPHYFLGNYCAAEGAREDSVSENEGFIRQLISGKRRKTRDELFDIAERLGVAPTFIKLSEALSEESNVEQAVEDLIKRYGLSYVDNRAVLLFDITEFSLYTPFEQASQLNSLSYSLNSAYSKLLAQGVEVNFARTTTGDGYYVWNRDLSAYADQDLYYFLLLVIADNTVARAASKGNTVPVIRTAYHMGSHYELYQAEGVSPTVFSYIVGNVTIELARMVDHAKADQILIGDFSCEMPLRDSSVSGQPMKISTPAFVRNSNRELAALEGIQLSGKSIRTMRCQLTQEDSGAEDSVPRRLQITDKHGRSRYAYNLQIEIGLEGEDLTLGLDSKQLDGNQVVDATQEFATKKVKEAVSPEKMYDDLAQVLKRRSKKKGNSKE